MVFSLAFQNSKIFLSFFKILRLSNFWTFARAYSLKSFKLFLLWMETILRAVVKTHLKMCVVRSQKRCNFSKQDWKCISDLWLWIFKSNFTCAKESRLSNFHSSIQSNGSFVTFSHNLTIQLIRIPDSVIRLHMSSKPFSNWFVNNFLVEPTVYFFWSLTCRAQKIQ